MQVWDITPRVSTRTAVFPGDTPFQRRVLLDFPKGDGLALSSIQTTVHIGAHADAPSHYHPEGASIDERSLEPYIGRCWVVDARGCFEAHPEFRITLSALEARSESFRAWRAESKRSSRVLFRTDVFGDGEKWVVPFASFDAELVRFLADQGARLLGIDTPSIDPAESKAMPAHKAVYASDLSVLEGLDLRSVEPGTYTLVALPLRLEGLDASPVRAILVRECEGLSP